MTRQYKLNHPFPPANKLIHFTCKLSEFSQLLWLDNTVHTTPKLPDLSLEKHYKSHAHITPGITYRSRCKMKEGAWRRRWFMNACLCAKSRRAISPISRSRKVNCGYNHTSHSSHPQAKDQLTYLLSFCANALVEPVELWLPELWAAILAAIYYQHILLVPRNARLFCPRKVLETRVMWSAE